MAIHHPRCIAFCIVFSHQGVAEMPAPQVTGQPLSMCLGHSNTLLHDSNARFAASGSHVILQDCF